VVLDNTLFAPAEGTAQVWDYSSFVPSGTETTAVADATGSMLISGAWNVIEGADNLGTTTFSVSNFQGLNHDGWGRMGRSYGESVVSILFGAGTVTIPANTQTFPTQSDFIQFPLQMDDTWDASYVEETPFSIRVFTTTRNLVRVRTYTETRTVVGSGTLSVPNNGQPAVPFDALLVKVERNTVTEVLNPSGSSLSSGINNFLVQLQEAVVNEVFYEFYKKDFVAPVAEINPTIFGILPGTLRYRTQANITPPSVEISDFILAGNFQQAGLINPNTYYYGVSAGNLRGNVSDGSGNLSYLWSNTTGQNFRNNAVNGVNARIWYPSGATDIIFSVTDQDFYGMTFSDTLEMDWVDVTCNQPLIWWYTMCPPNVGPGPRGDGPPSGGEGPFGPLPFEECVATTFQMRQNVNNGWTFPMSGFCGLSIPGPGGPQKRAGDYEIDYGMEAFEFGKIQAFVFPNPSAGQMSLRVELPEVMDLNVRILDLQGRVLDVREIKAFEQSFDVQFSLSHLASGYYVVQMTSQVHTSSIKFQIVK
jgi:hypothetical protein